MSSATAAGPAWRVAMATSGNATVVTADPTALVDCPTHSSEKFRVRSTQAPSHARPATSTDFEASIDF
ncbi:hypothetical protein GCM10017581_062720 [Dactylosporangium matsuzakiense]|uniref:Uncharacterized protein n=1 Tax=Dactylosporangium matsuzakiense TaxID=53360 RepID=A0A9W6NNZ9_9ACTN|nr:hypothetical protein GCM10017581_062720 [Dactylosporangium matsuzakiense]